MQLKSKPFFGEFEVYYIEETGGAYSRLVSTNTSHLEPLVGDIEELKAEHWEDWDQDKEYEKIVIRVAQATEIDVEGEHEARSRLNRGWGGQLQQVVNQREIYRRQAYQVLARIEGINWGDAPAFQSGLQGEDERIRYAMSFQQFSQMWGNMPTRMVNVIMPCIWAVNPMWNPNYTGE